MDSQIPSFVAKLAAIQQQRRSDLGLLMSPRLDRLPLSIQRYDDPFFPFGKAIVNTTRDLVCSYMFDFAAYVVLGAAGFIALERTIDYIGSDTVTILHGGFALLSFAQITDENALGVDAVTLADNRYIDEYTQRRDRGAFIINERNPMLSDAPDKGGLYWIMDDLLTTLGEDKQILQIRLVDVPTAGLGDDFGSVIQSQLMQRLKR
jgi:hypothetical protein